MSRIYSSPSRVVVKPPYLADHRGNLHVVNMVNMINGDELIASLERLKSIKSLFRDPDASLYNAVMDFVIDEVNRLSDQKPRIRVKAETRRV